MLKKATVDANEEIGQVCYPVQQFRCLLAETGTGMHILGKGLLVISEDWFTATLLQRNFSQKAV